jgi:hypothetical protein
VLGEGRRPLALAAALTGAALALGLLAGGAGASGGFTLGDEPCELIPPARSASAVGGGQCEGVRPGALVESRAGKHPADRTFCTLNFLFRGSDGRRYIGTAGHCVLGESSFDSEGGSKRWRRGGPRARDSEGDRIGRYAYAVLEDPRDFALIRLRRGVESSPRMCHFGGPTGVNADQPTRTVVLNYYGNGLVAGETVPARTLYAFGMPDPDHVYANGPAVMGDSGAPVNSADGRAVGVLVTFGLHVGSIGSEGIDAGVVGITRLPPQLQRASEALGIRLRLLTAPVM